MIQLNNITHELASGSQCVSCHYHFDNPRHFRELAIFNDERSRNVTVLCIDCLLLIGHLIEDMEL